MHLDRRVRRRVGDLLATAPRDGGRDRADPGAAVDDRRRARRRRRRRPLGSPARRSARRAVHLVGSAAGTAGSALLRPAAPCSRRRSPRTRSRWRGRRPASPTKLTLTRCPATSLAGHRGGAQARGLGAADPARRRRRRRPPDRARPSTTCSSPRWPAPSRRTCATTTAPRCDIPTMVPVNVRPLDEPLPRELGNRFALVLFSLPSGLDTPFARLAETKRRMDAIKHSPEAVLTFGLIRGDRAHRQGPRALPGGLLRQQGQRGHHQRAGSARAALPRRHPDHLDAGLGARVGQPDAGHLHLHLRRPRARRLQGRPRHHRAPRGAARRRSWPRSTRCCTSRRPGEPGDAAARRPTRGLVPRAGARDRGRVRRQHPRAWWRRWPPPAAGPSAPCPRPCPTR